VHVCTLPHCSNNLGFILQWFNLNGTLAMSATHSTTEQSAVMFFAHVCVGSDFFQVFRVWWGRAPWCSELKWTYWSSTLCHVCAKHWRNNMAWEYCSTHKMFAPQPLCPLLILHELTHMIWNWQLNKVMCRIMTFWTTVDCIYDGGPIRLQYYYIIL
jgi:hypothetical protein